MKFQRAWFTASTFAIAAALAACGSSSSDDSASTGATSSGGSSSSTAGSTSSAAGHSASGGTTGSAGSSASTAGGTSTVAGAGGSAPSTGGTGGASTSTGGKSSGGASSGGAASGGAGGGTAGAGGAPSTQIPDQKVVMYLPNWNGTFQSWASKIDFNKMTHLNLAFGTMSGSTNWTLGGGSDDGTRQLVSAAHAKNVKVLISIGGADDDIGIINAFQDAGNIDAMVTNLDAFVTSLTLDGVDVDLERGTDLKSSGNFPQFLAKLEAKMHGEGKLVTAATAEYIVEDSGTDQGVITYLKSYDFLNLMIYTTNMGTYTSELNWWTSKIGMAKTKLTWGIEFDNSLSTSTAKSLTTASLGYGGVMVWEYSQPTESTLWPAVQSVL